MEYSNGSGGNLKTMTLVVVRGMSRAPSPLLSDADAFAAKHPDLMQRAAANSGGSSSSGDHDHVDTLPSGNTPAAEYTSLAVTNNPLIRPTWAFFNALLGILYLLHCYWFALILRSGLNFLRTGKAKDMIANLSSLDLRSASSGGNLRKMA